MDDTALKALLLHREVEDFLLMEADLLDDRRFADWLALCTDDIRYWMPMARNVQFNKTAQEYTREQMDTCWIDEGKETLTQRVKQLATGIHWAEEPQSRVSHLITNIRITEVTPDAAGNAAEVQVRSRFLVYRNRLHDEVDIYVGKRRDTLRKLDGAWKIARREIFLDQNVLLAKNITTFF
ncbi:3-phenylpropionate/cinnamic acid dioxygenase subunit beta [Azospirillum rugosum]|uniref:3-phenylpropionate/cinnamic acid dioxygenase small subunit n=1 Tax=Azospirillum rugosum TaxID=416170 RepID=A0ABS4SQY9_9PROT|nr:3-phenylpropionate/cinnamic acid dioxygenase subunit beta [Azospirillum rugosum]MBP2294974.1 3-phenylpropionate/cinnamic acid dioxygenase small subunit [Azospirillum rugosum]